MWPLHSAVPSEGRTHERAAVGGKANRETEQTLLGTTEVLPLGDFCFGASRARRRLMNIREGYRCTWREEPHLAFKGAESCMAPQPIK